MSDVNAEALRRELLLKQAINAQLGPLVKQATKTATLLANTRMEESQLRNLLNVAIESRSVEVVINFILYQIARNGSAWGQGPNDFGHTVIRDLRDQVPTFAATASQYETRSGEAFARVMQLYLGYLNRAFYYGKKTGDFARLKEMSNGK